MDKDQLEKALSSTFAEKALFKDDALKSAQATIGALPMVANAIVAGARKKVVVKITKHAEAVGCTDGKTIWIRPIPLPGDGSDLLAYAKVAALAYGLIHHEVGHVNHTDFNEKALNKRRQLTKLAEEFFGAIEDVRMENAHLRRYPNARLWLDAIIPVMILTSGFSEVTENAHPMFALTGWVLYEARTTWRHQPMLSEMAKQAHDVVARSFPASVVDGIEALFPRIAGLKDTLDSCELAEAMAKVVEDAAQQQPNPQQEDQEEQADDQDEDQGETNAASGDTGENGADAVDGSEESEDDANGDANDDDEESEGDASGDANDDDGEESEGDAIGDANASSGNGNQDPTKEQVDNAAQAANGSGDGIGEIGDILAKALEDAVAEATNPADYLGEEEFDPSTGSGFQEIQEKPSDAQYPMGAALAQVARIRNRMRVAMQAQTDLPVELHRRGARISDAHIHRAMFGDPRIFRISAEEKDLDTSVVILIDRSGSMHGCNIEIACQSAYATAVALESITGIRVAVAAFPSTRMVKPFDIKARRIEKAFSLGTTGTTPLEEGVMLATRMLEREQSARKLLLVATDGVPDSMAKAKASLAIAEGRLIETYGIGIGECLDAMGSLFNRWESIQDIGQLSHTLLRLVEERTRRRAA